MSKSTPLRMCVSCREMHDKKLLLRVARNQQGQVYLDLSGKGCGRGAYICAVAECLQKARKKHSIERALQAQAEDSVWEQLQEEIIRRNLG